MLPQLEGVVHKSRCGPEGGMSLMTGDRRLGISLSRKGKAAGRFHFTGVMLWPQNLSASSVQNAWER